VLCWTAKSIGRGHNQRVQHGSVIHHAEMNCLENAAAQASVYQRCVLYSTLSPCLMCSGAILLYKNSRLPSSGKNKNVSRPGVIFRSQGVQVDSAPGPGVHSSSCAISSKPDRKLWNEDIGV